MRDRLSADPVCFLYSPMAASQNRHSLATKSERSTENRTLAFPPTWHHATLRPCDLLSAQRLDQTVGNPAGANWTDATPITPFLKLPSCSVPSAS